MITPAAERQPRPVVMAAFFAVIIVLFSFGAAYDLRDHAEAWRWFAVTVAAGAVAGAATLRRGKVAEDTSMRGAMQRTKPWMGYMVGVSLLLNVAGPVAGGLATGFAIGMSMAGVVFAVRWWATGRVPK